MSNKLALLALLLIADFAVADVIPSPRPRPTQPPPKKPQPSKPSSWIDDPVRTAVVGAALSLAIVSIGLRTMRRSSPTQVADPVLG